MKIFIALAFLLIALTSTNAIVFSRCGMAQELHYVYNIDRELIDDWVCLIQRESGFNASAIGGPNSNGSFDWGLFQVNDGWWCVVGEAGHDCNIDCWDLVDDDISDDVACAKLIYSLRGFEAWNAWKAHCAEPPSTDECF